jgi:hypothetical protein
MVLDFDELEPIGTRDRYPYGVNTRDMTGRDTGDRNWSTTFGPLLLPSLHNCACGTPQPVL